MLLGSVVAGAVALLCCWTLGAAVAAGATTSIRSDTKAKQGSSAKQRATSRQRASAARSRGRSTKARSAASRRASARRATLARRRAVARRRAAAARSRALRRAASASCARSARITDGASLRAAVDAVLCLVNRERARRRATPLRASRQLGRAALEHSRDMVRRGYFSHVSPEGVGLQQRIVRSGYGRAADLEIGEAITWGAEEYGAPVELVRSFMISAGHRRILLERRFRDVGVGLALGAPVSWSGSSATLTLVLGRR